MRLTAKHASNLIIIIVIALKQSISCWKHATISAVGQIKNRFEFDMPHSSSATTPDPTESVLIPISKLAKAWKADNKASWLIET